jgi:hypothetical protein
MIEGTQAQFIIRVDIPSDGTDGQKLRATIMVSRENFERLESLNQALILKAASLIGKILELNDVEVKY